MANYRFKIHPSDQHQETWVSMKGGNHNALKELYLEYSNKLYNYGAKFTADKDLVKDCVQELFVNLWERRQYVGRPQDIKNYLFKSFRLAVFKKAALLQRRESLSDVEDYRFHVTLSMEDPLILDENNEEIKRRLQSTLNLLTARQREAIFLKFYEGLSYNEIAVVMNISVKGTYKLMARALDMLRNNLDRNELLLLFFLLHLKLYR